MSTQLTVVNQPGNLTVTTTLPNVPAIHGVTRASLSCEANGHTINLLTPASNLPVAIMSLTRGEIDSPTKITRTSSTPLMVHIEAEEPESLAFTRAAKALTKIGMFLSLLFAIGAPIALIVMQPFFDRWEQLICKQKKDRFLYPGRIFLARREDCHKRVSSLALTLFDRRTLIQEGLFSATVSSILSGVLCLFIENKLKTAEIRQVFSLLGNVFKADV